MPSCWPVTLLTAVCCAVPLAVRAAPAAPQALLEVHCAACHSGAEPQGGFAVAPLAAPADSATRQQWRRALQLVRAEAMPPPGTITVPPGERRELVALLQAAAGEAAAHPASGPSAPPRRLNNRELANSLRDVLMIEDVGTHQPLADLPGDTLSDGFDTDGDALGMSHFHLDRYIAAFRKVLDAAILSGPAPPAKRYSISAGAMRMSSLAQRRGEGRADRTDSSIDFLDPRLRVYFPDFRQAPASGRYRISIRATGVDRGVYEESETGIYHGDPIRLAVHLGGRERVFELPDERPAVLELDKWVAKGTRLELSYPTDGLRLRGNGNFKFQFSIAHDHLLTTDPALHAAVLRDRLPKAPARTAGSPRHWSHWTGQWQGPRPRVYSAEIEGPLYEAWPPARQLALLGRDPRLSDAQSILLPIARRAWRREVEPSELEPIVRMITARVGSNPSPEDAVGALKDGIVAILASPSFLLINTGEGSPSDRFATKLSYFLRSTIPDDGLREASARGQLSTFTSVRDRVQRQFESGTADEFLREFPTAWLDLDRINFMAPDPDRFPLYARKSLSEDMVAEVLRFFRHIVESNRPVPELLTAGYTFLNADLARIYGVDGVPQDSRLRRHAFTDGRRGGLLGMGAFLTLTADTLTTSPIHRAVYVMSRFFGIHPAPPPPGVEITEPDIRQARTIKEVLAAHTASPSCASCHQAIDPWGYAFENFGPTGAWRDHYTAHVAPRPSRQALLELEERDRERASRGEPPEERPWERAPIPVDASSQFPGGSPYRDMAEYRAFLATPENQLRFVRCFVEKLLTYANGAEPRRSEEVDRILSRAATSGYRMIDTIAAVVDSPLFRELPAR